MKRGIAVAMGGVVVAVGLGACSNDAEPGSSNRGGGTETSPISVENVFIVPRSVRGACAVQVGATADLNYLVSNSSSTDTDQLLGITTDIAQRVQTSPATPITIPVGGTASSSTTRPSALSTELVGLAQRADPGKSFTVAFRFAAAGTITIRAAVEACPAQAR